LMKGADPGRKLTRIQILDIIRGTASYQPLKVTQKEKNYYRLQASNPWTGIPGTDKIVFDPGTKKLGELVSIEQYYFGTGLVNAMAAIDRVKVEVGKAP
jgi:serine protease